MAARLSRPPLAIGLLLASALASAALAPAALVPAALAQPAAAPVPLSVELASGRKFTGLVDARTSDERLVLRFGRGAAVLRRSIAWDRVRSASIADRPIEPAELRRAAVALRTEHAEEVVPGKLVGAAPPPPAIGAPPAAADAQSPAPPAAPRVTSVSFDARLANWDGDVETDGIVVDLFPLAEDGYVAAARGTVEIELFAPQTRLFHHAPLSGGDTLERVERWTRTIGPDDFVSGAARLKLPFGAVHPEFDLDWIAVGLVHVRLVVPGDGVFEDSIDGLRIRPYAPLRDRLEQLTGRRFLPTERLGRGN